MNVEKVMTQYCPWYKFWCSTQYKVVESAKTMTTTQAEHVLTHIMQDTLKSFEVGGDSLWKRMRKEVLSYQRFLPKWAQKMVSCANDTIQDPQQNF